MAERLPNLSDLRSQGVHNSEAAQTEFGDSAAGAGQISTRQRRLWTLFQQTATSLTHLYKCKSKCQISSNGRGAEEDQEAWLAFQSAASALTSLYRDSADILSALEKTSNSNPNSVSSNKESDTNDTNSQCKFLSNFLSDLIFREKLQILMILF